MKLKVLGSSSSGNCYILESKEETLIIELGVSFKEVLQVLDTSKKVVGALITHEHGDHSKSVKDALAHGIKAFMTSGTASKLFEEKHYFCKEIKYRNEYQIGHFKVVPFETEHDVEEPCGFIIKHPEMGTLVFATDTYYIRYNIRGVNHWMIECNYSEKILDQNIALGNIHPRQAKRVQKSHFEFENVKEFFRTKNLQKTKNVVLLHLSAGNSDVNLFIDEIHEIVNKPTYVAYKGLELDLTLCPF